MKTLKAFMNTDVPKNCLRYVFPAFLSQERLVFLTKIKIEFTPSAVESSRTKLVLIA